MSSTPPPVVISAHGLGKNYRKFAGLNLDIFKKTKLKEKHFWALDDLSFDIRQGEGVGIIGHNGAGKSTLLKILARIVPPSTGEVTIHGRVNSLLEVGTGFQRELSGRSNIYLNASILGMSRSEVAELFDEIVAFSGIGEFIDMPVKNYSSGMYSRLAFAIAANVTGDILLVDEVLSVGDAEFRRKSLSRMSDMMDSKRRTVLFVSHSMDAIVRFCERVMWLDHGKLRAFGPADEVIREYLTSVDAVNSKKSLNVITKLLPHHPPAPDTTLVTEPGDSDTAPALMKKGASDTNAARILHVSTTDVTGQPQEVFFRDEPVRIHIDVAILEPGWQISSGLSVRCLPRKGVFDETIVFTSFSDSALLDLGRHTFSALIPKHLFASGQYIISIIVASSGTPVIRHHILKKALSFRVIDRDTTGDIMGERLRGVVQPNVLWMFDDG